MKINDTQSLVSFVVPEMFSIKNVESLLLRDLNGSLYFGIVISPF